jgi:succinate dehydrogenase/fumarate reductase flavoprotein subunit
MIVHASMARKASSDVLGFNRLDYPAVDPAEWKMWIVLRNDDGQVRTRKMPLDFWKPPAAHYEEHNS